MDQRANAALTTIRLQHYSQVSPRQVAKLRADPSALAGFLKSPDVYRNGLGMYWHAVPYLLTGVARDQDEPYCFFMKGGETIGRNEAGDVRYLSPGQVAALAGVLKEEPPDELGLGMYDEAAMDRHEIYPARWVRTGDNDHLGTIRELYSYVRDMVAKTRKQMLGLIVHFETEPYDDTAPEPPRVPAAPETAREAPRPSGEVFFTGEPGRAYFKADAAAHPSGKPEALRAIDAAMDRASMRHVGDMITPDDPTDVLRSFVSEDHTVVAILYLSDYGVGGYRFYSRLPDALVASSNTFIVEMKKFGFFADSLQGAEPARLHEAVVARRQKLEKKHGTAVVFEPTLAAVAGAWEEQHVRCRRGA
jgi:hypothetical protein